MSERSEIKVNTFEEYIGVEQWKIEKIAKTANLKIIVEIWDKITQESRWFINGNNWKLVIKNVTKWIQEQSDV